MKKLRATSLEELLVVLSVTGIITIILLDAWRMTGSMGRRLDGITVKGMATYDSLSRNPDFVQEAMEIERRDSLKNIQDRDEETNE